MRMGLVSFTRDKTLKNFVGLLRKASSIETKDFTIFLFVNFTKPSTFSM
jgi:hypothetical protein